jgi:ferrous iron transport protein A
VKRRVEPAARVTRALDELRPGESSVIVSIDGEPRTARRLMELGLVPGTTVEVVRRAPMGDPVELRVRRTHLSIRRSEAERVHVESD